MTCGNKTPLHLRNILLQTVVCSFLLLAFATSLVSGQEGSDTEETQSYKAALTEVLELEQKAQFHEALQKAQKLQRQFDEHENEIFTIIKRLRRERQDAAAIEVDIEKLGSDKDSVVQTARRAFRDAGKGGRIYLRNILLDHSGRIAKEATDLLFEMEDEKVAQTVLKKLAENPSEELTKTLFEMLTQNKDAIDPKALPYLFHAGNRLDNRKIAIRLTEMGSSLTEKFFTSEETRPALKELALTNESKGMGGVLKEMKRFVGKLDKAFLREVYQNFQERGGWVQRGLAGLLVATYTNRCEQDSNKFNELISNEKAYKNVKEFVKQAVSAVDGAWAAWGYAHAAPFDLVREGFQAEYYKGVMFNEQIKKRQDTQIAFFGQTFPMEKKEAQVFSVRWTGQLQIPEAGTYTFYIKSDDGHRMWIDGEKVSDKWKNKRMTSTVELDLDPGSYAIKLEYMKGMEGKAYIYLMWEGPNFGKRFLDSRDVASAK